MNAHKGGGAYRTIERANDLQATVSFRISQEMKDRLEEIAEGDSRSLSYVCWKLLKRGLERFEEDGSF